MLRKVLIEHICPDTNTTHLVFLFRNAALFRQNEFSLMTLLSKYPELLKNLFALMGTESDARVRDNIVAAVCRMMSANAEGVPLDQVRTAT